MSEILNTIKERRSLRASFDPSRPISKENIIKILDAARWAPTGHNMQNYEVIFIDDKVLIERIGNLKSRVLE
jgi:nitroreductase